MERTRLLMLPALVALAFSFGAAQAQTTGTAPAAAPAAQGGTGTRNTPARKLDHRDRKFVESAAQGGMFEVQVGQLAVSKASDPNVKSFAQMLVEQHTQANNELTQLANAKGVEMPAAPKHSQRREIEKLGKRSGADFDQHFVREVGIKAHEKDIKSFQKAAKDLKDPDLRGFAQKTLPMLQNHLAAAQRLPQSGHDAAAMGAGRK